MELHRAKLMGRPPVTETASTVQNGDALSKGSRSRHLHPVRPRRSPLSPSVAVRAEESWLFTDGEQSVRLTRAVLADGTCHLLIDGPTDAQELRSFADIGECITDQRDFEQRLRDLGFHLESDTSDRRLRPE